jgi:hypothetical protein
MPSLPRARHATRAGRLASWLGAYALLACATDSTEPPAPAEARLRIDVTFPRGAPEGPVLEPSVVRLTATPPDSRSPVTLLLPVQGRTASGEMVVERFATAERWRLRGAAAVGSDTLFRVVEDVLVRVDSPRPDVPLVMIFGSRDLSLATLEVAPRDTALGVGGALTAFATGRDGLGDRFLPAVGWRSRQPTVATVDASGRVAALAVGTAWIVARSWTGLADSMRVVVR